MAKTFEVREHDAPTKFVWNGDTRIARVTGSLSANPRVQRLRVYPGWNLCSLGVTAPNATAQLKVVPAGTQNLFSWNPVAVTWSLVPAGQTLPAGTVFWLNAGTNTTLAITGPYSDPTSISLSAGPSFFASSGLELWSPGFPQLTNASFSKFDALSKQWQSSFQPPLGEYSSLPDFVAPGEALFSRSGAPASLQASDRSMRIRYYHHDHLGSSSCLTDFRGNLIEETTFYPFGAARHEVLLAGVRENYLFTQKEKDVESGLICFEARFLSGSARFLRVDPTSELDPEASRWMPQRLNEYAYAVDRPLNFIDPDGKDAIPLAFPDYKISALGMKLPYLGHAGVLLIDNKTGETKYFEYGRYDPENKGLVRSLKVPNVKMKDGSPTESSLKTVLKQVSLKAGHGGRLEGAYFKSDEYGKMKEFAEGRMAQNKNPKREPYSILSNNCGTFSVDVVKQDSALNLPTIIDPRPRSIIGELQTAGTPIHFPAAKHDNGKGN